eukprot:CAMPEP_0177696106 /NCGR_PEP_ID=MMETSP0484_2-20121128/3805_1 /TAXON_ID=354590 /ORGANISM="Rhodomonas lens, Strain RHODO" /LENGTH=99 /DNA_ID=CAMNT_0019207059 /DNA_START=55 /DNA_END=354 /DNA_ORIENTATION=+
MSQMSRTMVLRSLSKNTSKAMKVPENTFTVCLQTDAGIISEGTFGPSAMVTVTTNPNKAIEQKTAEELQVAITAALTEGFPIDVRKVKFIYNENKIAQE